MNVVVSGSPLDETLAAAVLENREKVLGQRSALLAAGASTVAAWVEKRRRFVDWVRPDGGALCCLRLNPEAFDAAGVARFWAALPEAELQLGDGAWFGEPPTSCASASNICRSPSFHPHSRRFRGRCRRRRGRDCLPNAFTGGTGSLRARTIAITNYGGSPIADIADVVLCSTA